MARCCCIPRSEQKSAAVFGRRPTIAWKFSPPLRDNCSSRREEALTCHVFFDLSLVTSAATNPRHLRSKRFAPLRLRVFALKKSAFSGQKAQVKGFGPFCAFWRQFLWKCLAGSKLRGHGRNSRITAGAQDFAAEAPNFAAKVPNFAATPPKFTAEVPKNAATPPNFAAEVPKFAATTRQIEAGTSKLAAETCDIPAGVRS
jgi:hypothetical protein